MKRMLYSQYKEYDILTPKESMNEFENIFGKNSVFPVRLTHSIPDNVGYALNTMDGTIFYTGNYVFDATMLGPYKTDIGKLAYIGKQGVLCLLGESMYADKTGYTSPKNRVYKLIRDTLNKTDNIILYLQHKDPPIQQ